ncbi:DUF4129 domain-containing protein [Nocardiopsis composta]|uniref:Protein-glutamine gamma-glutamyltransferase-like C-terminal domain-containing protein n=1 Tax=Nocardiopsis composta TaxID=157465 RepID=A0A7W8VE92_9ACTN|nr:DUF4129 domain-containing protein [Nocardiopsis composta]MBB5432850.1 hypothetical protein [Nocardiopsis composta]
MTLPLAAPAAEISREEGARIAGEELSDPAYAEAEPGLIQRIWDAVSELLGELLDGVSAGVPGGWWTLGPLLLVLAAAVVLLVLRTRPARAARMRGALFETGAPMTAADHRAAAERHAARGEHAEAVREFLRAVSRDLEERAVITARPGRTATELAADAGAVLPDHRAALEHAAAVFNASAYGGVRPGAEDTAALRDLDAALSAARPAGAAR